MGAWPGGKLLPRVSCLNDSRDPGNEAGPGGRLGRGAKKCYSRIGCEGTDVEFSAWLMNEETNLGVTGTDPSAPMILRLLVSVEYCALS